MAVTSVGLSGIALRIGSNVATPSFIGIGSGSGLVAVGNTGLVFQVDRNAVNSVDYSTVGKVKFIATFSATAMSGIGLKEFGNFTASSGGKLWLREGFSNIQFTGAEELEIDIEWRII
jgi:hypothetical protein